AVPPHPGETRKVALLVPRPVLVAPKVERHRWHGPSYHELPHLAQDGLPGVVVGRYRRPEIPALDGPRLDGQGRVPAHERSADVGPPAYRCHPEVFLHVRVEPL